jgi:hypothetical protein
MSDRPDHAVANKKQYTVGAIENHRGQPPSGTFERRLELREKSGPVTITPCPELCQKIVIVDIRVGQGPHLPENPVIPDKLPWKTAVCPTGLLQMVK